MNVAKRLDKKIIYAIKFEGLPFPEIDKYVCVPFSWIIHRLEHPKVLVAYPENEAPFVTRNRTKKRERYSHEWSFYIGYIKYESVNYEDVVQWIEEMIAKGDDDQDEEPEIKDLAGPSRILRSSKTPLFSDVLPDKPRLAVKPYNNNLRRPLPRMLIRRPLPLRPWKSRLIEPDKPAEPTANSPNTLSKDQPVIVENRTIQSATNGESTDQSTNNHSMQESVDTSAQSPPRLPDDRHTSPKPLDEREPSPVQDEQPLSVPSIDVADAEMEVEDGSETIVEERPPSRTSEQAPQRNTGDERATSMNHHDYLLLESRLDEIHNGVSEEVNDTQKTSLAQNPTVRPPSRANQPSQHDNASPLVSIPCSKQSKETIGTSSEVTCSNQTLPLLGHVKTIPSSTYYTPNPTDLSLKRQVPASRTKLSAAMKQPAEKKIRLENITKNIPTAQQSLYNKQLLNNAGNVGGMVDQRHTLQSINTSAAHDLSHLAHQARFYEPSQLQSLQQIAQMQKMISQPNVPPIDQRTYLLNAMITGGYVSHQPNQINQPTKFFPQRQNQRSMVNINQMQELMRHELLAAPPPAAQIRLPRNLENTERQDLVSYQDPRLAKPLEFQSNSGNPKPQVTEERRLVLPKTNQQVSNGQRSYSRKDLLAKLSCGPIRYLEIRGATSETIQDSETQTTSSESQETQSLQVSEKNVYHHPESKKLVVDQATEMESIIDDQCEDETVASPPEATNSGYETYKHSKKEQKSPQKVPDSKIVSADEELLDDVSTDGSDYANEDVCSEEVISSLDITEKRSIDVHNLIPETQQKLSTMEEQEMMEVHGLLLTKMYKNFLKTEEFYNDLRVSTLGCIKLHEMLLNKVNKVNVTESPSISTSNAPETPQVAQETPVLEPEQNSHSEQHSNSRVNASKKEKRRHMFVLPPEYDPNDSRWTLKHREPGPGLMELLPPSRVYVNKAEYKKCIQASNDCRTLTRLLLTAVFSKNALSVCSPTGAKAKAFINVNIDVRPGLDENARMVLLAFIEEYGNKRNWNTSDTAGIMSSIRTKIQEMRNKYGKTRVV